MSTQKEILFESLTDIFYVDGTSEPKQVEPVNIKRESSVSRYGDLVETEVQPGVYDVSYANQELYLSDLANQPLGFFVGE